MSILIKAAISILNIIYAVFKLLPVKKKIVYVSRQSNSVPIDFYLIKSRMEEKLPDYKNVILAKTIDSGIKAKVRYSLHMMLQMYHIATARIVILDTYCIVVSVLKQRESLLVVQIWHALGALKRFGYSILDMAEGSSSKVAELMKMHNNYSYVFTSGENSRVYFAEAFHQPLDRVKVFPLPRLDLLLREEYQSKKKKQILEKYPFLSNNGKKIVVYAPTFRKDDRVLEEGIGKLFDVIDYDNYDVFFKPHPLSKIDSLNRHVIYDKFFSTEDMLYIADYVITDYSAVIYEAMLLRKTVILYAFDYEEYIKKRDFYLDYPTIFSNLLERTADGVVRRLNCNNLKVSKYDDFIKSMVAEPLVSYTEDICDFLIRNSGISE